ncbi:LSU rRNA 2'-O-methyl-C2498 methyltransferase rlmM [Vibrio ishigakensis]|nr:LSU rRNA 2'-O-methyl-C2498 methyltransferase rlmM [Vibrio ishigakensis]
MKQVILYCRAGFEKDCAAEIQEKATRLEVFGYPKTKSNSGYVLFECYTEGDAERLVKEIDFQT